MSGPIEAMEIVACGFRPEASLAQLAAMAVFVWLAWRISPRRSSG